MSTKPHPDRPRVDAHDKVLGKTLYAADMPLPGLLHAMTVPATIPKGRIAAIDAQGAMRVPGVVRVFTHRDFTGLKPIPATLGGGPAGPGFQPMTDDRVRHRGQLVAMVVAETLEAAIEGAALVVVRYDRESFTPWMDAPGTERGKIETKHRVGDAAAAFATAPEKLDISYVLPQQHQNPMEMISTTAVFRNGELSVWEGTQNSGGNRGGIAGALGLEPTFVHFHSPYLGGGFGQKSQMQQQTVLVCRAAIVLGRPVKLVMPRGQLFHTTTFRPASNHRVRLGATREGKLTAALYDTEQQNSRIDQFVSDYSLHAARMYGIGNWTGTDCILRVDAQAAGYMRAPHEHPASVALECTVDEMAYKLGMDPVALRLANDTDRDPIVDKPFTSRFLADCLRRGADRFGWSRRDAEPGAMRADDGMLIGWGVAAGAYKANISPVIGKLRIQADGVTALSLSGHEMGQGIRTAIAAELLSLIAVDPSRLDIQIGEPDAAPQHTTGGSWGTASVVPATRQLAEKMSVALVELSAGQRLNGNVHRQLARLRRPFLEVDVEVLGPGQEPAALERLRRGMVGYAGPIYPNSSGFSWIAHFVEVRVEPRTRRVRVPRVVSVADCGRVMNPRTAASQVHGGVVWGIGAALREISEVDHRYGRVVNNDLADYVVPVNADIDDIEVELIDQPDPMLNPSGVKGLGEVAMVGVAPAILNAVFHATGKRIRELPLRIEMLL